MLPKKFRHICEEAGTRNATKNFMPDRHQSYVLTLRRLFFPTDWVWLDKAERLWFSAIVYNGHYIC